MIWRTDLYKLSKFCVCHLICKEQRWCRARGSIVWFDSRFRRYNFIDWLSPASKSRYGWNIASDVYPQNNQPTIWFCTSSLWYKWQSDLFQLPWSGFCIWWLCVACEPKRRIGIKLSGVYLSVRLYSSHTFFRIHTFLVRHMPSFAGDTCISWKAAIQDIFLWISANKNARIIKYRQLLFNVVNEHSMIVIKSEDFITLWYETH